MSPLCISWVLSTISGYGIYGLQIVMQYLRRGGQQVILPRQPTVTEVPPLTAQKLAPIFDLAQKLHAYLKERPDEMLSFNHPVLHGVSTDFAGFAGQDRIWGKPNVGCAAIEHMVCTPHGRAIAKNYDMFIAISRWNADYLKSLNVGPVYLRFQGIDPALFHPLPKSDLYKDRFVIFSGGKFEYRKGQDIVVAAFKRFREKHPEALLVACWQNLLPADEAAFAAAGHVQGVPQPAASYGLEITPWLLKQGLPSDSFIDLPFTHNLLMPLVLRECDMALFPNRCEGGTNLVAMEAAACGVPTYVADNTGQKDLVELIGFPAFSHQGTVKTSPVMDTIDDWGETDVDEVVQAMEHVYTQRQAAQTAALQVADRLKNWDWGSLNEKLLRVVCEGEGDAW